MARKRLDELGSLQRLVVEILWDRDEATVQDVADELESRHGKKSAYTTVLTVLQKLRDAGWVRHRQDGRTYIWRASDSRREAGASSLRGFVDRVFRGDRLVMFEHLLEDEALSAEDLSQLKSMLDARTRELGDGD